MSKSETLLITRSQVRAVLTMEDALAAVEAVFKAYGEGRTQMPPKSYLVFEKGDLRCMPAYLPEVGLATVKNVNVHPHNTDLPPVMATVTLFDPGTGSPLAIMDGTYLTAMRTGAAGGVAAKYLAREDAATAGLVGAGRQAETQLAALMGVRPGIRRVMVCDADAGRAAALAERAGEDYGVETFVCSLEEAVRAADVLVTTTPVHKPLVRAEWVRPGTHVNAIGADASGKQELESDLVRAAKVVVDNWEQASHGGEINVPVAQGVIRREDIFADLGEVVSGKKPGRESADEITVFDSTGLAVQDAACAAHVYRKLTASEGAPTGLRTIDFMD